MIKVSVKDRGWKALQQTAQALEAEKTFVKAGVLQPSAGRSDGIDNVSLAVIHEFGSPEAGVPQRSFIRSSPGFSSRNFSSNSSLSLA